MKQKFFKRVEDIKGFELQKSAQQQKQSISKKNESVQQILA